MKTALITGITGQDGSYLTELRSCVSSGVSNGRDGVGGCRVLTILFQEIKVLSRSDDLGAMVEF